MDRYGSLYHRVGRDVSSQRGSADFVISGQTGWLGESGGGLCSVQEGLVSIPAHHNTRIPYAGADQWASLVTAVKECALH